MRCDGWGEVLLNEGLKSALDDVHVWHGVQMGSFCVFSPLSDIPPVQMGSFCVFLYPDNRIGGDCGASMYKSASKGVRRG